MKKIPYYAACTRPWEEFILHSDLSFSPCCFGPKVGKIETVDDIDNVWNGEVIRKIRSDLLNGILNPMCANCPRYKVILNRNYDEVPDDWVHPYKTDFSPALTRLNILITEKCNLKCIMCNDTDVYPNRIKDGPSIPFPFIRRLGEKYFSNLDYLNPNCFGEFFVYENFADYLDLVERYQPKLVDFNTNASLNISEDTWLRVMKTHKALSISLDAATRETYQLIRRGSNWDNVFRNVDKIHSLREKHQLDNVLRFNFVLMKINLHEFYEFIRKAAFEWGGDGVSLLHVDGEKNASRSVLNDSEWRILYNQELRKVRNLQAKLKNFTITTLDYAYDANGNIETAQNPGKDCPWWKTKGQTNCLPPPPPPPTTPASEPLDPETLRSQAKAHFDRGAFSEAGDLYQQVCREVPSDTEALICQAECRFQHGHFTLSKLLFKEAVECGAKNPMATKRLSEMEVLGRKTG